MNMFLIPKNHPYNYRCSTEDFWCVTVAIFAFALLAISFGFVVCNPCCNIFCYAVCNQTRGNEITTTNQEDRRPTLIVTQPSHSEAIIEELDEIVAKREKFGGKKVALE